MDLFYKNGFHATGIDRVIAEAGIAKMTLYNHFESKESLITECLRYKSDRVITWIELELAERPETSKYKLFALFDIYESWFRQKGFKGCIFTRAAGEYPDQDHPVHKAAAAHTARIFELVSRLTREAGAANSAGLAEQYVLLLEGATSVAFSTGATIAARRARRAAYRLLGLSH